MKSLRAASFLAAGLAAFGALAGLVALGRARSNETDTTRAASSTPARDRAPIILDERRQQMSGVRTTRVVRGTLSWPARAFGVVTYDASRVRDFNLKLDGWVRDLYVTAVGQRVRKNDPLLTLSSQELTGAQLQYLAALRSLQQLPPAQLADREYQERLIETPRQRLLYWDIPPDQLKALQDKGSALEAVTFRSPSDGVVIELAAVKGMHVAAGEMLYKIADSSVVWIEADFNTVEVEHLSDHASAVVTVDSLQQSPMSGRVLSQYPAVSDQTRTTRVRIEVPNPQGRLKPGMFARVEATVEPVAGLVVPDDAVLDSGLRQVVFVAQGDGHFEPRAVVAGARANGQVLILSGVREGELVVSRGAFLVDSESQLRAALEQFGEPQHRPDASQKNPRLTVRFGTGSEQPRASATDIQVEMRNADDTPMTDATVDAQFYMAPMPSMNMAAMRSSVRLTHVGGGVYRAREALSMAGRWDVTISATRDGVRVVSQQTSLVAR